MDFIQDHHGRVRLGCGAPGPRRRCRVYSPRCGYRAADCIIWGAALQHSGPDTVHGRVVWKYRTRSLQRIKTLDINFPSVQYILWCVSLVLLAPRPPALHVLPDLQLWTTWFCQSLTLKRHYCIALFFSSFSSFFSLYIFIILIRNNLKW